jgi:hypothetical protein
MVDTYTRWMLTIIAATLIVLTANNVMHVARADIGYARVQICDERVCSELLPLAQRVDGRQVWALPVVNVVVK